LLKIASLILCIAVIVINVWMLCCVETMEQAWKTLAWRPTKWTYSDKRTLHMSIFVIWRRLKCTLISAVCCI